MQTYDSTGLAMAINGSQKGSAPPLRPPQWSKAFYKMDPNTILIKLKSLGTNDRLLHLINDFLTDRQCCVKIGEKSDN